MLGQSVSYPEGKVIRTEESERTVGTTSAAVVDFLARLPRAHEAYNAADKGKLATSLALFRELKARLGFTPPSPN